MLYIRSTMNVCFFQIIRVEGAGVRALGQPLYSVSGADKVTVKVNAQGPNYGSTVLR